MVTIIYILVYAALIGSSVAQLLGNRDARVASLLTTIVVLWAAWVTMIGFFTSIAATVAVWHFDDFEKGIRKPSTLSQIKSLKESHSRRTWFKRFRSRVFGLLAIATVVCLAASGHTKAAIIVGWVEAWDAIFSMLYFGVAKKVSASPSGACDER